MTGKLVESNFKLDNHYNNISTPRVGPAKRERLTKGHDIGGTFTTDLWVLTLL